VIEWYGYLQVAIAVVAGLLCLAFGLAGRKPNDLTIGATALVELLLIAQVVISLIAPAVGNSPTGSLLEFWIYLISALFIPPVAIFWALVDRGRWSTVVLSVAGLAVAVMVYRMIQIWFVQVG
jgi:uncharacterized membrane protein YqaE (UPF0057 family)